MQEYWDGTVWRLKWNIGDHAYETGSAYIRIEWEAGKPYLYTYASVGAEHVEAMKRLA